MGEIMALLRKVKFGGVVSFEWEKLWHPYLPDLREALVRLQMQPWFQDGAAVNAKPPASVSEVRI